MNALLLDTNIVSILFKEKHGLREYCIQMVSGHELAISFMSKAELLLWPEVNQWGLERRTLLLKHMSNYATLYPDEVTCSIWVEIVAGCRRAGRPIQNADAWIAAVARQWSLPLVTANVKDFEGIPKLYIVAIG